MESCKKAKTNDVDSTRRELEDLKRHILSCREVPQDSLAVRVCLQALADEVKRIERDEKLRMKFMSQQIISEVAQQDYSASSSKELDDDTALMNDWQDIAVSEAMLSSATPPPPTDELLSTARTSSSSPVLVGRNIPDSAAHGVLTMTDSSPLGLFLANVAISELSKAHVLVSSPTAAIALALHAVLRSHSVGFKCTGIPDVDEFDTKVSSTNNNSRKGFAAPVRELKPSQFLPDLWDQHAKVFDVSSSSKVLLRYRHDTIGAVTLRVALQNTLPVPSLNLGDSMISIRFGSTLPTSRELKEITFDIKECFNLESFISALKSSNNRSGVLPALHYIDLPIVLTKFAQNFDLGVIQQGDAMDENACEFQDTVEYPTTTAFINSQDTSSLSLDITRDDKQKDPTTVFSQKPGGDFADDLFPNRALPSLLQDPRDNEKASFNGSLMGPNHPIFQRDYDPDVRPNPNLILPGGLGMQPRFDPFYPPGVGGDPMPFGRGRAPTGLRGQRPFPSSGDPNPDHQRPPNDLGGHMFM